MTAQTSSFQRYQNYQKRTSLKEVTHQTMKDIFPKIPDATIVYNVLMPTESDLDGQEKIEIFKIGAKTVRRHVSTWTRSNISLVASLSHKPHTQT